MEMRFKPELLESQVKFVSGLKVKLHVPLKITYNGKFLHSKYDPQREAARQIGEIPLGSLVLVFGSGFGFAVRAILDGGNRCVWFEPDPEILGGALSLFDFEAELRKGQLRIVFALAEEERMSELFEGEPASDIVFFSHKNYSFEQHLALLAKVDFFLNKKSVNLATLSRFDRLWARNVCANLPLLASASPVRHLFGSCEGRAAVIASAGPSLNDSLEELASVRTKIVLIAVDTAARILTQRGLDPDFIVSVDPQPINRHYLEGYQGSAKIIVDPTVFSGALRHVRNQKIFFFWSPFGLAQ